MVEVLGEILGGDEVVIRSALNAVEDGISIVDNSRRIVFWNEGAAAITGYAAQDVLGRCCDDDILTPMDGAGNPQCGGDCPTIAALTSGERRTSQLYLRHQHGRSVPVRITSKPLRDAHGRVVAAISTFQDMSEAAEMLRRLHDLEREVIRDPLTGVGNRRYLEHVLAGRLNQLKRFGWPFSLLFCDLDDFKLVNDRFGHAVGDQMLRLAAATISGNLRNIDEIARFGGDEFVVCLPGVAKVAEAAGLAERLRTLVAGATVRADPRECSVTVSIGVTTAVPEDTTQSLIERVDGLLYRAKHAGKDQVISS